MIPQVDLQQQFLSGLQTGSALRKLQQDQLAMKQAQQRMEQYKTDLIGALQNPSQSAWAKMISVYPEHREAFKDAAKLYGEENINNQFMQGMEISNALEHGNLSVAKEKLGSIIEGMKNAKEEPGIYKQIYDAIENGNVTGAQAMTNFALSGLNPEKFQKMTEIKRAEAKAPFELSEAESKAKQAAVASRFAEDNAVLDLQKKGWDINKIQNDIDIAKQNTKIAAANNAISKETNALKRQELQIKIDEMKQKRTDTINEKTADIENARTSMDNMLNTADRLLANPSLSDVVGSIEGRLPAVLSDEAADAIALIDNLKSQTFVAMIPSIKGMGALSDTEGKKLESSLQSLNRVQSEKQFITNVKEAQRLIQKGRANLAKRYGVPETSQDRPTVTTTLPQGWTVQVRP